MMPSAYGVVGQVGGMLPCGERVVARWDADGLRCMFVGLVVGSAVVWSVCYGTTGPLSISLVT